GAGIIMVLDEHGKRAGADIVVPGGGDPVFTADEGRLFVTTARDPRAVVVQPDGATGMVDLGAGNVPETRVDTTPAVTIPAPPRDKDRQDREEQRSDDRRPDPAPTAGPVEQETPDPLPTTDPGSTEAPE